MDVTFDLNTEKFKPYTKPTNTSLYVHRKSNHPPNIVRNIPESVNKRLSEISPDEEVFNQAAPLYANLIVAVLLKKALTTRKNVTYTLI